MGGESRGICCLPRIHESPGERVDGPRSLIILTYLDPPCNAKVAKVFDESMRKSPQNIGSTLPASSCVLARRHSPIARICFSGFAALPA